MAFITTKTAMYGQFGAKDLVKQYGDRLLTVRYKYDECLKYRIKIAEIIKDWNWEKNNGRIQPNKIVN